MLRPTHSFVYLAFAGLLAGCAGGSTAAPSPQSTQSTQSAQSPQSTESASSAAAPAAAAVEVRNIAFKPASLEVPVGTEVTWTSFDAGVVHTATSGEVGEGGVPGVSDAKPAKPDGVFDGPLEDAGATYSFTFEEPGTYAYFCAVHPSMTGEIVVR
jgi:plastocyanin